MNIRKINVDKIIYYAIGWGIIPLAYLSWCFLSIGYKSKLYENIAVVVGIIDLLLFLFVLIKEMKTKRHHILQIKKCAKGGALFCGILIWAIIKENSANTNWGIIVLIGIVFAINIFIVTKVKNQENDKAFSVISRENIGVLIVILIGLILSYDSGIFQIKWDGLLYYDAVKRASICSVSSVALYGHIAVSSGLIYRIFGVICGDIALGMYVANVLVMGISSGAFYGLVKKIVPQKRAIQYVLATACYVFSPFILGMSGYFSTDWFCVCIVTILLYYIVDKNWIAVTIWACVFVMTKEPALIAYAGICSGLIVSDLIQKKELMKKVKDIALTLHYYYMLIPYFLWFGTYKIMGKWSAGSGGFEIDIDYILRKSKVLLIYNFNWLIVVGVIVCILIVTKNSHIRENGYWIMPMLLSNICLFVFNILFATANHVRYIDSFISINIVLAVVGILKVQRETISNMILGVGAIISLISCYRNIDPVSYMLFNRIDLGDMELFYTSTNPGGDSSIYNKQMLWIEKPFGDAISDAILEGSSIVIPTVGDSIYSADGMSELIFCEGDYQVGELFWNRKMKKRVAYASERVDAAEKREVTYLKEGYVIDDNIFDSEVVSVIYIDKLCDYSTNDDWKIIKSDTYKYRGWKVIRDQIKKIK